MEGVFYAAAALPQSLWARLEAVVAKVRERPLWFTSAWGATETSPAVTTVHWRIEKAGCLGLPLPGVDLKLVPNGNKLEMRVKGPNIFPGYLDQEALTAKAFDEEGFYRIGDAGKLIDEKDPDPGRRLRRPGGRGLQAVQRHLGQRGNAAAAHRQRDGAARGRRGDHRPRQGGDGPAWCFPRRSPRPCREGALRTHVLEAMQRLAAEGGGSSQCPTLALIQDSPPSADLGEITDKGYINQRAVLEHRAADVALLHRRRDPRVIRL